MYEYTHVLPQIYRDDRLSINFLSLTAKNIEAKEADRRTCYRHQKKNRNCLLEANKDQIFSLQEHGIVLIFIQMLEMEVNHDTRKED